MASHPVTCPPLIRLFLLIFIPTSPRFWCHALHGVDGWSDSSGAMWCVIGQRQRNSYYLHLSVIYFSSVRLKMAARDGDKPVWPSKHCPLQIPLFIHKLDPLGLRGRLVRSVDPCDVCVWVCGWWQRKTMCVHAWKRLWTWVKLVCRVTRLTLSPQDPLALSTCKCVFAWAFYTHTTTHAHTHWQTEATVLLSGNE